MRSLPGESPGRQAALIAVAGAAGLAVLVAVKGIAMARGVPLGELTQDPAAVSGPHDDVGLLTHAGVILWTAAAGTVLAMGYLAVRLGRPEASFLLGFGWLTLLLGADDILLIHERVEGFLGFDAAGLIYAGLFIGLCSRHRAQLLATPWPLLAASVVWFAASVAVDVISDPLATNGDSLITVGIEDSLKFMGIVAWWLYAILLSRQTLREVPSSETAGGQSFEGNGGARSHTRGLAAAGSRDSA